MANQDKWCYYSFEVLDPQNADPMRRDFVHCQTCLSQSHHLEPAEVYYHTVEWQRIGKCLRCDGSEVVPISVDAPAGPAIVNKTRPLLPSPNKVITIPPSFEQPLTETNPINQLRRLWWLIIDPVSARAYAEQHGSERAANLDWWLACTLIYITALFFAISTFVFVTPQPEWYLGVLTVIFISLWLMSGRFGTLEEGLMKLLGPIMLGLVSALFILSVLIGPSTIFTMLSEGLNFPINSITERIDFRTDEMSVIGLALLFVIAIALAIIPQSLGYKNIKPLIIHLIIVAVGVLTIQLAPSTRTMLGIGMVTTIALPVLLSFLMRSNHRSGWLTPFSLAVGLLLLAAWGLTARAAAFSLANLERFPETEFATPNVAAPAIPTTSPTTPILTAATTVVSEPTSTPLPTTNNLPTTNSWPTIGSQSQAQNAIFNDIPTLRELANEQRDFEETDQMWQEGDTSLTFTVNLNPESQALWSTSWCAIDSSTLDQNLANVKYSFSINEQPIQLNRFMQERAQDDRDLWCYNYDLLLTEWPLGQHELLLTVTIEDSVNDGFAHYPAATHTNTFIVEVDR